MLLLRLCQGCRLALAKRPLPAKGLLAPLLGGLVSSGRPWASVARAKAPPKALRRPKDLAGPSTARLGWAELWRLLRPYSLWLLAAIAAALLAALLNVRIPLELGKLVGAVAAKDRGLLLASAAKLVSLYALQGLLSAAYIGLVGVLGERVARDLRRDLFAAVIHQDMAFFDERRTGEIVARLSSDVQEFKSALKLSISQGLRATTQTAGSLASLWLLSPEMAGWTVAVVPAVVVGGALLGSGLRSLSRASQEQTAKAVGVADEAVSSVRTVRAFAAEAWEEARFARETDAARRLAELLGFGIGLFQGATNLFLNGTVLAVLYKGAGLIEAGELAPGDLYPFNLLRRHVGPAQETVQRSLGQLSVIAGQAIKGASAGGRVLEYIKAPRSMPLQGGHVIPKAELRGELELRDVTFAYPSRPHAKVLEGMSLRVPAKSTVALCGPSGQGKSTVAALLERFYDVDSGSVLVDGADVRSLDAGWLRGKALGFIAQEPVLFAGSVADNIRYGRPDASQADVEAAAHLANAHDFVKEFPDGYQTEVGERGGRLSGGQKQRIAIARALIKDPAVLILDEATSALDPASEAKVQEALRRAASGRTVVIIAHRLSTIQHADTIAVLSGGKVHRFCSLLSSCSLQFV